MAELRKLGRYELRSVLGKGAMGVVYEGYDPTLSRRVAVKTILKSVALDDETERTYAERFVREAKAVARLNHANIVQVHDFGVENDVAYLVMEFIQGRELRSHFLAGERFETAECVRIMGELLDALDFAHEAGVIHRDIKPANVMLDAQRRVKLADFGVARVQDSERSAAGTMVGTPAFMSPEQISGKKIDRRTDIFSAGTILYQLLTGEQPFKGEGAWTVAKQIMQDEPPRPSSISLNLTPAFDQVVNKALAKSPGDRFASARLFSAALRGALAPGAVSSASVERRQQPRGEIKASDTELEFWRSIQNRDDLDELELYVEQFPDGAYTQLARLKIAKLKEPMQAARKAAEEKARQEAEAQEKARQEAEALAQRQAEEKARRDAQERARRESLEQAQREAAAKAKRDTEEKARQAQALARMRQQEEAAARARRPVDDDATVAVGGARSAARVEERKTSYAVPAVVAAVMITTSVGAYLYLDRKPVPVPVADTPVVPKAATPAPLPKAEVGAADVEKIRKEAEERVRREYAEKSAAEQAALAKAAAAKAVQEKQLAMKAAAEKATAERAAAEKAARSTAERAAEEKAAAVRAAEERAAAAKAAEEKAAAAKAAEERAAAARAAEKAAAAAKAPAVTVAAPPPPLAGLPGRYAFRYMTGAGPWIGCDRNGFEEEITIPAGGPQTITGRQFSNLQVQAGPDNSVAGRMFDASNRFGSGEVKLTGGATATGYAGSYEVRYSGNAAGCWGRWTLVRK